jgi:hypothetical protein
MNAHHLWAACQAAPFHDKISHSFTMSRKTCTEAFNPAIFWH